MNGVVAWHLVRPRPPTPIDHSQASVGQTSAMSNQSAAVKPQNAEPRVSTILNRRKMLPLIRAVRGGVRGVGGRALKENPRDADKTGTLTVTLNRRRLPPTAVGYPSTAVRYPQRGAIILGLGARFKGR